MESVKRASVKDMTKGLSKQDRKNQGKQLISKKREEILQNRRLGEKAPRIIVSDPLIFFIYINIMVITGSNIVGKGRFEEDRLEFTS